MSILYAFLRHQIGLYPIFIIYVNNFLLPNGKKMNLEQKNKPICGRFILSSTFAGNSFPVCEHLFDYSFDYY